MADLKCEGNCEVHNNQHLGEVVRVRVIGAHGTDWGFFNYCQRAIEIDRSRGLSVEPEKRRRTSAGGGVP